jgi:hypothetical protein
MKNTVKYLAILVVVMMVSSALFAAQGGNSANCTTKSSTDAAVWGGNTHSASSDALNTNSSCKVSNTGSTAIVRENDVQHGLGRAIGKLVHSLGAIIDTATWGGGGNYGPPR